MTPSSGPVLRLPEPCLVILIGAAGAGKSTVAARFFAPAEILSSDALRAVVSGDQADQRATKLAFAILDRQLDRRLAERRTTVIDATNVTPFARRALLRRAAARDVPVVALVLDLDPSVVLARNAARPGRVVPELAVRRQLAELARSFRDGALDGEGFSAVHLVRTPAELDALSIQRSAG